MTTVSPRGVQVHHRSDRALPEHSGGGPPGGPGAGGSNGDGSGRGSRGRPPAFTVALPVYNEVGVLPTLHERLTEACAATGAPYEILYVDDGSRDGSDEVLRGLAAADPHVAVVTLSRNFGHGAALAAAVDLARGESLVLMDADLQDDPAAIPRLFAQAREEDADVVYVVRARRKEGPVRRSLFNLFHRVMNRSATFDIPRNAGSFGLIGPRALGEIRRLTERTRYFPGLRAFVGFNQVPLEVERGARYDRSSRVGLRGLARLAGHALFSQSRLPVNALYVLSGLALAVAVALAGYALVAKALGVAVISWTSMMTALAFFSSTIILGQALIAEYLARIYEEVRRRPPYVVDEIRSSRDATARRDARAVAR